MKKKKSFQFYGRDIIALALIGGIFAAKLYFHINGGLDVVLAAIVGYYFSKRVFEEINKK